MVEMLTIDLDEKCSVGSIGWGRGFPQNAREKGFNLSSNSKLEHVHDRTSPHNLLGLMLEKNRFPTRIVHIILLAQQFPNYSIEASDVGSTPCRIRNVAIISVPSKKGCSYSGHA